MNRRCPDSFWIIIEYSNKLPTDNVYDYYYHEPHKSFEDYAFFQYIENNTKSKSTAKTKTYKPNVAEIKSQFNLVNTDIINILMETLLFIVLLGKYDFVFDFNLIIKIDLYFRQFFFLLPFVVNLANNILILYFWRCIFE